MQESLDNEGKKLVKAFGEIVRKHRNLQNKTIYKIAAESSMSKSTWRDVELGVSADVKITTFWKIAEGLNISPTLLLEELRQNLGEDFSLTGLD